MLTSCAQVYALASTVVDDKTVLFVGGSFVETLVSPFTPVHICCCLTQSVLSAYNASGVGILCVWT